MSKKLSYLLILLLFVIGIGLLSYPALSKYLSKIHQSEVITQHQDHVEGLYDEEKAELMQAARAHNQELTEDVVLTDPFDDSLNAEMDEQYEELLNPAGNGVMGHVEIPAIDVYLPIYHGTSVKVLEKGAGHLRQTSLPVGGNSTHSVLSAHSGMTTAMLFTELTKLKKGNEFYFHILDEVLAYEIDQILIVEPSNTDDLTIIPDEDYATLVTCTPHGINSHRLLVRGTRVPYREKKEEKITSAKDRDWWFIAYLLLIPIILVILIYWRRKRRLHASQKDKRVKSHSADSKSDE